MNTHDRKRALLDWLRESGSVTAEEAAQEFGVSLRTLHRDIAALRLEGIPVEGEPGRGGGIKLDPMAAVPSVSFEPDEVVDLLLTLKFAQKTSALIAKGAEKAIKRLEGLLTNTRAKEIDDFMKRVVVNAGVAGPAAESAPNSAILPMAEEAVRVGCAMRFEFEPASGKAVTRTVAPGGFLVHPPAVYLLAIDVEDEGPFAFQLDRMKRPRLIKSIAIDVPRLRDFNGANIA